MQKAIIVKADINGLGGNSENLVELNQHLKDGWTVKFSSTMGGTDALTVASLVILEK